MVLLGARQIYTHASDLCLFKMIKGGEIVREAFHLTPNFRK
jgi:hypothetical protein